MKLSDKIISYNRTLKTDKRGWFLKTLTGTEAKIPASTGEIYFTAAIPGQVKGKHYHINANEWFTLIVGKAVLILEDINTKERLELILDSQFPQTVHIPPLVAHSVENRFDSDFILCAYTDLKYDPKDTIPYNL